MALGKVKTNQSRKDMLDQPDQFISSGSSALDKVVENPKLFLVAIGGILAALFLGILGHHFLMESGRSVGDQFAKAQEIFSAEVDENAKADAKNTYRTNEDKYNAAVSAFETFLSDHDSGIYAPMARMYLALSHMKLSQFDKAEAALKEMAASLDSDDPLWVIAQKLLGQCLESQEKWGDAHKAYMAMVEGASVDYLKDEALYMQARMLERMDKKNDALALYKKLMEEYPTSGFKAAIDKRKAVLENDAPAAPAGAEPAPAAPATAPAGEETAK